MRAWTVLYSPGAGMRYAVLYLGAKQARVSDFSFLHGTNLRTFQSHHAYSLAVKRQKFHFKCFTLLVDMNHCPDISGFQSLPRNTCF